MARFCGRVDGYWSGIGIRKMYLTAVDCLMAVIEPLPLPSGPHVAGYKMGGCKRTLQNRKPDSGVGITVEERLISQ